MSVRGVVRGMAVRANPAFAVGAVAVPLAAFLFGLVYGSREALTFVHVMAGVLWTGFDVLMALVIGPVLGSLSVEKRASWFGKFTPKSSFLLPVLAAVTIFGGIFLAVDIGVFPNPGPWIGLFVFITFVSATLLMGRVFDSYGDRRWQSFFVLILVGNGAYLYTELVAAGLQLPGTSTTILLILAVMFVLTVQGFGFLLPNEVLIYKEIISDEPDEERIDRLGMRNAKLSGVQGLFQIAIIVLMVYLRWGGI